MSYEAKATFLNSIGTELTKQVTAHDLSVIMEVISTQLDRYDLTQRNYETDSNDDLLEMYLSALLVQGRSTTTIDRYRYIISKMKKAVNTPTRQITVYHLRRYLADEKQRGVCDSTLESNRQVFSSYFNWLHREGLITNNPVANLGAIKVPKKVKKIYSQIDIENLKQSTVSVRDKAIICFLLTTGCRITEMAQLNRTDIDFAKLECKVTGKGNKERIVYMDALTGMLISDYLKTRDDTIPALFIGQRKERLNPSGVRSMMRRLSNRTGVTDVHPHKFRRTMATNLIRHGMPIQEVAHLLGHDKLDTTMQYVVMDQTAVANEYRRYT